MHSDLSWESTGEHTLDLVCNLLKSNTSEKMAKENRRYIIIDELETGLSKEVLLGVCNLLNTEMDNILKNSYGVLLITHSDEVVTQVKHDVFLNIEGMTEEEWLNREIVPVSPDDIREWSLALFRGIRNRSK
jgi:ABC-type dipeptide/oligopeptide/nickel transport system ATPase component